MDASHGDAQTESQPDAALDGSAPQGTPRASVHGNTVELGPLPTGPGEERTLCVVVELANDAELAVRELRAQLKPGSHHLIAYRTEQPEQLVPYACSPNPTDEKLVIIAQSSDSTLRVPEQAVLRFAAHEHVRLELHYFNDTGSDLDVGATLTFAPHQGDASALASVHTRFTGELSITVPPGDSEVKSFFPVASGERFFALTTHTHRLGVLATLARATSAADPAPTLLHESHDWAEPPITQFDPPLTFDGDGLLLTCKYHNDTGQTVGFGLGARDEMCFYWGYYF